MNYRHILVSSLLFLSTPMIIKSQEMISHKRAYYAKHSEACVYRNSHGETMLYRLFMPPGYDSQKKYPLLLAFHGAGSRGDDNLKHLRDWVAGWTLDAVQLENPCIVLMPQCPLGQQWVDTPWKDGSYTLAKTPMSKPMKLVKEILDNLVKQKSVDENRIYVMGASMGGYGTWNFVMHYPKLVAAAIPICGAGDPSRAAILMDIPIWAFHGDEDDIVPVSGTCDMRNAVKRSGGTMMTVTIYQGVKHNSYSKAWKDKELIEWVFKQRKTD